MQSPQKGRIIDGNGIVQFENSSPLREGLASGVEAQIGPQSRDMLKAVPLSGEPQIVLIVHGVVEAEVEPIPVPKYPLPEEAGSRWDVKDVQIGEHKGTKLELTTNS